MRLLNSESSREHLFIELVEVVNPTSCILLMSCSASLWLSVLAKSSHGPNFVETELNFLVITFEGLFYIEFVAIKVITLLLICSCFRVPTHGSQS